MVNLLDDWESMLPEWIMENILDQLILPRIRKEVDAWNPLTDMVPIHAWIHPWLIRLGNNPSHIRSYTEISNLQIAPPRIADITIQDA